jgi:hypothetical protein
MILNMIRASLCSSSGGQLYIYSIWYRPTLYAAIQCTDQERTQGRSWSVHWIQVYTTMHGQKTIKLDIFMLNAVAPWWE